MIGCTITLVKLTRSASQSAPTVEQPEPIADPTYITQVPRELLDEPRPDLGSEIMRQVAEQYTEALGGLSEQTRERKPRAVRNAGDQEKAIDMLLIGDPDGAVEAGLMGTSTMRRYKRVLGQLKASPNAIPDCAAEKVRPELVERMRSYVNSVTAA